MKDKTIIQGFQNVDKNFRSFHNSIITLSAMLEEMTFKLRFLETKLNVTEEEYNAFKKEFIARHQENKINSQRSSVRPEDTKNEGNIILS